MARQQTVWMIESKASPGKYMTIYPDDGLDEGPLRIALKFNDRGSARRVAAFLTDGTGWRVVERTIG